MPKENKAPDTTNPSTPPVEKQVPPEPTPKRKRTPKTDRTLEQLHEASTRSMTETEMRKYIEALRSALNDATTKAQNLENNCRSAYEKCRVLEQKLIDVKTIAKAKLHFAKQAISTCHSSIVLAGGLEEE